MVSDRNSPATFFFPIVCQIFQSEVTSSVYDFDFFEGNMSENLEALQLNHNFHLIDSALVNSSGCPSCVDSILVDSLALYCNTDLEQAQPEATFEQKVAVLVARDGVEKKRQMDQNPQGETYAKLLSLDERLRGLAKLLSEDDKLTKWKDSVNAAPNMWW